MTLVLGTVLASGLLLVVAPWFWPRRTPTKAREPFSHLQRWISEAGWEDRMSPRSVVAVAALIAAIGGAVGWLLFPALPLWILVAVACATVPFAVLRRTARRRTAQRRALWPDVCDLLISSVRAGVGLPDAVAGLAQTGPIELRADFSAFGRDVAASGHFDAALVSLKMRLADPVADRIVETLRMAREVGGSELVPTLRALSAAVRADAALRAEVDARQSWIRSAAVLGAAAPWVILALLALRPETASAYATPQGLAVIVGGAVITYVAFRLMLRVGRLPEPRRWFA